MSLEELTNIEVSSVNKKVQRRDQAAAAVFVITQDDIRRSGARSIPQALRLVPGLQVAQIDGSTWAISARGFNSRFANRLLVLMDGRTLYTLTFGGVFWDAQDTMIEDIERIEVIRGPGGAIWGTNAFNGVINIITKSAAQTGGSLVSVDTGTQRPIHASARIGDSSGRVRWRAFGKGYEQDPNINWMDETGHDSAQAVRIGGRIDIDVSNSNQVQLSAEAYRGKSGAELWNYAALPSLATIVTHDDYEGAFLTMEWGITTANNGRLALRAIADYTNRDSLIFGERRNTYEAELQHSLAALELGATRHELMWGVGLRYTEDATQRTAIAVYPANDSLAIYNGFVQDELSLWNDKLDVTVGTRVEHNDYIGTQFMPNLRGRYNVGDRTVAWAALSRGIRSPSRLERDVLVDDVIPPLPPPAPGAAPVRLEIWGDPNFAPEKLTAFELGLRHQVSDVLALDLATYLNKYSAMRGLRFLPTLCAPQMTLVADDPACIFGATKIVVPMQYTNLVAGSIWGAEATASWNVLRNWRLTASYAYLHESLDDNLVDLGGAILNFSEYNAGLDASGQWTLRSNLTLGSSWDWDIFLRHVNALPASGVDAYTELNTRIAWRPQINFEVALVGDNLLHDNHREFISDFIDLAPVVIRRSAQLQARWSF